MDIEITSHATREDAEAHMNSPDMLARANAYYDAVKADAEAALSPEDLAVFRFWWDGGLLDWSAVPKQAYGAIMQAISQGCG